jgi:hypothetical protein
VKKQENEETKEAPRETRGAFYFQLTEAKPLAWS